VNGREAPGRTTHDKVGALGDVRDAARHPVQLALAADGVRVHAEHGARGRVRGALARAHARLVVRAQSRARIHLDADATVQRGVARARAHVRARLGPLRDDVRVLRLELEDVVRVLRRERRRAGRGRRRRRVARHDEEEAVVRVPPDRRERDLRLRDLRPALEQVLGHLPWVVARCGRLHVRRTLTIQLRPSWAWMAMTSSGSGKPTSSAGPPASASNAFFSSSSMAARTRARVARAPVRASLYLSPRSPCVLPTPTSLLAP
jgi:hypothetical protein